MLRRFVSPVTPKCEHIPDERAAPRVGRCQGCGSTHLRLCATCGHVGCCDSQSGHARSNTDEKGHPVINQMPADAGFIWCYVDDRYVG